MAASRARWLPESRGVSAAWMATLAVSAALVLVPFVIRMDGKPHANWQQFLGRFHPLAVHLPIGFLVLLPLLEIVGAFRPALREAAGLVLNLACVACLGALTLGYLLAYGSGDVGAGVTRHMWGGIALTICVMACALARPRWLSGETPRVYPGMLAVSLLVLVWTAHQGGSLTYGSGYLTEYLPAPLKRWTRMGTVRANTDSFYTKHIDPIFDANCVSCHGQSKVQGGLRLDSYEWLMRGGKDGAVIIAGNADRSLLFQRVTLPVGHKQFMPAEGRPPLKPEEIAWIKVWVQQGASPAAITVAGVSVDEAPRDPPLIPVGDYSSLMPEIRQMDSGQGAKLVPVSSKPVDGLILSTVDVAASFGDAQLTQFQKFAPYIVEAELGRTVVTDASFDMLSKFTHLRALHLEGTAVTGAGLAKLASLTQLTYLNLSGTKVTSAAVATLGSMKNLHHIYLFNTPAQPTVNTAGTAQPVARSAQ